MSWRRDVSYLLAIEAVYECLPEIQMNPYSRYKTHLEGKRASVMSATLFSEQARDGQTER